MPTLQMPDDWEGDELVAPEWLELARTQLDYHPQTWMAVEDGDTLAVMDKNEPDAAWTPENPRVFAQI